MSKLTACSFGALAVLLVAGHSLSFAQNSGAQSEQIQAVPQTGQGNQGQAGQGQSNQTQTSQKRQGASNQAASTQSKRRQRQGGTQRESIQQQIQQGMKNIPQQYQQYLPAGLNGGAGSQ